jgi:hypothetical protein
MRGDSGLCPDYPLKTGIPAHKPRPRELPGDSLNISSVVSVVTGHVVAAFLTVVLFVIEFIGVDIVAFVMVFARLQIIVCLAFVVVLEAVLFIVGNFVTEITLAFIGLGVIVIVTVMEAVLLAFVIITAFVAVFLTFAIITAIVVVFESIAFVVSGIAALVTAIRTRHLENNTLELSEVVQDLHRYIKVVVRKRRYRE